MSNKNVFKKIFEHPDREEIISKLVIGISPNQIYDWLKSKYTNVSEGKFVISEKYLENFKDQYLDVYKMIQEDIINTRSSLELNMDDKLELAVKNNNTYKTRMLDLAGQELDIKTIVSRLATNIELRLSQIFDSIQENPNNVNTKIERVVIEYADALAGIIEKYHKFTTSPGEQIIQNNVTLQVVDQHILVFYDVIKDILSEMDLDKSMQFMEIFNEKMSKLKPAPDKNIIPTEVKLAEVKFLNETINKKLSE